MSRSLPSLRVDAPDGARAVALILHGGADTGNGPVRPWSVAALRMLPFAGAIRRRSGDAVAVALLRYRVRGWNGAAESPVGDAEWALDQLAERFPGLPVGLVGHSMGGRTALRVGGHPSVSSVVALAPWIPESEPSRQLAGRRVLLVHGTADRITSARASESFTARLTGAGVDATYVPLGGARHAMLRPARQWHGIAADFVHESLLGEVHARRGLTPLTGPDPF